MLTFYQMVGQRVLEAIKNKDWSQQQLANSINVSKQVMSKILNGEKNTTILEIRQIADVLNVSLDDLLKPISEKKFEVDFSLDIEDLEPKFMGQAVTQAGKEGVHRAFTIIKTVIEYEDINKEHQNIRNQKVDFKDFKKVREFIPKQN